MCFSLLFLLILLACPHLARSPAFHQNMQFVLHNNFTALRGRYHILPILTNKPMSVLKPLQNCQCLASSSIKMSIVVFKPMVIRSDAVHIKGLNPGGWGT